MKTEQFLPWTCTLTFDIFSFHIQIWIPTKVKLNWSKFWGKKHKPKPAPNLIDNDYTVRYCLGQIENTWIRRYFNPMIIHGFAYNVCENCIQFAGCLFAIIGLFNFFVSWQPFPIGKPDQTEINLNWSNNSFNPVLNNNQQSILFVFKLHILISPEHFFWNRTGKESHTTKKGSWKGGIRFGRGPF